MCDRHVPRNISLDQKMQHHQQTAKSHVVQNRGGVVDHKSKEQKSWGENIEHVCVK